MFFQQIINGLVIGCVYALTAMGATLIYGILRILDIANAAAYVIGAYLGYYIYMASGNLALAFLGGAVVTGLIGVCVHRGIYAPILARPRLMPIIPLVASVAIFSLTSDIMRLVAGSGTKGYQVKFDPDVFQITENTMITAQGLMVLIMTAVLFIILWFFLNKTKMGLAWRASAEDPEIAQAMGVNTRSSMAVSYIIGYGFAAIAGILVGVMYNSITPAFGDVPSYKMLAIIVLGGLGNPLGTVLAGILIGLAETLISVYVPIGLPKDSIAFIALIIILLVKPDGLLSRKNKT